MRLAGFVAIVLVFIAVGAGFQGERFTGWIAGRLGELGPLVEPRWFGISLLEMAMIAVVSGVVAWILWRGFRR
jgi:Flp pilus assembly pilin Flp